MAVAVHMVVLSMPPTFTTVQYSTSKFIVQIRRVQQHINTLLRVPRVQLASAHFGSLIQCTQLTLQVATHSSIAM
jgi:hypothetical protein